MTDFAAREIALIALWSSGLMIFPSGETTCTPCEANHSTRLQVSYKVMGGKRGSVSKRVTRNEGMRRNSGLF